MQVLGIETSCDETAAAVVRSDRRILSNCIYSQTDQHRPFGGVVPEIAARSHVEHLDRLIERAMLEAGMDFDELDGIAVTAGPGLIGGLLVGLLTGKTLALSCQKPLIAVNHLEGHALTPRLTDGINFPFLLLLMSGGHCQLLLVRGVGNYRRLGTTIDDAVGEAFDKIAIMLDLGYPGGPAVESVARYGRESEVFFPRPMKGRPDCDFSFSGLKTAVQRVIKTTPNLQAADVAASFQAAVAESLLDRLSNAIKLLKSENVILSHLVTAGGVAANRYIRDRIEPLALDNGLILTVPPPELCTDNAAMIAWAGIERLKLGMTDDLDAPALARWPLDPYAPRKPFAGYKA